MRIYRNKFDVIVIDLEGEKEVSSIHVDTAGVLVVGEAIRPTKHAPDVVDSAASVSISTAPEASASEADSSPATTQVM